MRTTWLYNVTLTLLVSACATPAVPVAVSCPQPRPAPQVLTEPPSTGLSLSERFQNSWTKLKDSLGKATTP